MAPESLLMKRIDFKFNILDVIFGSILLEAFFIELLSSVIPEPSSCYHCNDDGSDPCLQANLAAVD